MRFVFFILTCFFLNALFVGCGPPYKSNSDDLLDNKAVHSLRYHIEGREIHYVERDGVGATILFIHGTPGSWEAFGYYLADDELASKALLISVDRPGFGGSSEGGIVRSLSDQARLLSPLLLRAQGAKKVVLVGHSLGAPLAARIALAYPDNIAGLLLIAPSLDPALEKPRWYNRLASYTMLQWLVPNELQRANVEVMTLADELQVMVPLWQSLRVPVTVIQGMEDKLVDPANIDFLENHIAQDLKSVRIRNGGHFILWKQPNLILQELYALLDLNSE
jgi:pimeloyl-ACP methyl ester carboxylesterase